MKNGLFSLDWGSLADALMLAVSAAVLVAFYQVVTTTGFSVWTANWGLIGRNMVDVAFMAGVLSLYKDFVSTTSGSVLNLTPDSPSSAS